MVEKREKNTTSKLITQQNYNILLYQCISQVVFGKGSVYEDLIPPLEGIKVISNRLRLKEKHFKQLKKINN